MEPMSHIPPSFDTLINSSTPCLIITGDGAVEWSNSATTSYLSTTPRHLNEFLSPVARREVLSPQNIVVLPAQIQFEDREELKLLVRIDVGGRNPGEEKFLLFLTAPSSSLLQQTHEREALTSVIHDLKNPLGALLGYADLLLETDLGAPLPKVQHDILKKIRATALRSLDLTKNYQVLFQARSHGIPRAKYSVDLNKTIEALVQALWRSDEDTALLSLELTPDPLPLYVETHFLDRIFSNLIGNAIKYTPPSGRIRIRSVHLAKGIEVHVINTAPLIPDSFMDLLFKPYERGPLREQVAGLGIGLHIAKTLVEGIGGRITCSTSPQGNDFAVIFPDSLRG